jgi:hypothetical protein
VSDHSFAAYIASFKGAAGLGVKVEGNFDSGGADSLSGIQDAIRGLAAKVQPGAAINLEAGWG